MAQIKKPALNKLTPIPLHKKNTFVNTTPDAMKRRPLHPSHPHPLNKKNRSAPRAFPAIIRIKLKLSNATPLPWRENLPNEQWIGTVEDYLGQQHVFITTLRAPICLGEQIHIRGCTTDIHQTVDSIEWNHRPLSHAERGLTVGIKTAYKIRKHDYIYLCSHSV